MDKPLRDDHRVKGLEAHLHDFAERHLLGQTVAGSAQAVADFAHSRGADSVVAQPMYQCPARKADGIRCGFMHETGVTCPVHLRDLVQDVVVCEAKMRLRRPLEYVEQTIRVT